MSPVFFGWGLLCLCVCPYWGFQYLQTLHLQSCDLLDVFGGISFFPLDKMTYLKIQSFVNRVEESLSLIKYTAFLYNDQLIWYRLSKNFVLIPKIHHCSVLGPFYLYKYSDIILFYIVLMYSMH